MNGNVSDWTGEVVTVKEIDISVTELTLAKPANLKGSPEELRGITPIAWKDDGFDVKQGMDAAQIYGVDIQNKVWAVLPPNSTHL